MRTLKGLQFFACCLLFATATAVQAMPMTWTDEVDFEPNIKLNNSNRSHTYQHSLLEDGFRPGIDFAFGGWLTIGLRDDSNRDGREVAKIDLPGFFSDRRVEVDFSDVTLGLSFFSLISINDNGMLEVTVERRKGDFYLNDSFLKVYGKSPDEVAAVAEPGTLGLISLSLIGLIAVSRCRQRAA